MHIHISIVSILSLLTTVCNFSISLILPPSLFNMNLLGNNKRMFSNVSQDERANLETHHSFGKASI